MEDKEFPPLIQGWLPTKESLFKSALLGVYLGIANIILGITIAGFMACP